MWAMAFAIAVVVACIAVGLDKALDGLNEFRFGAVDGLLSQGQQWTAFLVFVSINLGYGMIAGMVVSVIELKAKGSGIPEVKAYLNGTKQERVISLKTLLSKTLGVCFSVGGGLFVGKEGPMIHAGAIVGAVLSQMRLETLGTTQRAKAGSNIFRNDQDKRDFVSIGCACGVAGAFNSPVGGVLFVLEEAASHWRTELTWMTFFGTMVCCMVSNCINAASVGTQTITDSSFVSFGSFEGASLIIARMSIYGNNH